MFPMKRITISIPDEIYILLEGASSESMRPIATEALYRMKVGLSRTASIEVRENRVDIINKVGTIPSASIDRVEDTNYEQVISAIERINDPEYQSDSEEISEVRRMVREAGLSYNEKSKALWKQDGEKWKLIKQF